jgi:hypothetical protein
MPGEYDLKLKTKDNKYIIYRKNVYRVWFEYLKFCLQNNYQVNEKKYKGWDLNSVKNEKFDSWYKKYFSDLFASDLEPVKEIKNYNSLIYKNNPFKILIELPITNPTAYNILQVRKILKGRHFKDINKYQVSTKAIRWFELELYLQTFKANLRLNKNPKDNYLKRMWKLRSYLIAYRRKIYRNRKGGQIRKLNKKNLPTFFVRDKIWNSVFKRKINDVDKDDMLVRRISRYLQKAKIIISNVSEGTFPGHYDNSLKYKK